MDPPEVAFLSCLARKSSVLSPWGSSYDCGDNVYPEALLGSWVQVAARAQMPGLWSQAVLGPWEKPSCRHMWLGSTLVSLVSWWTSLGSRKSGRKIKCPLLLPACNFLPLQPWRQHFPKWVDRNKILKNLQWKQNTRTKGTCVVFNGRKAPSILWCHWPLSSGLHNCLQAMHTSGLRMLAWDPQPVPAASWVQVQRFMFESGNISVTINTSEPKYLPFKIEKTSTAHKEALPQPSIVNELKKLVHSCAKFSTWILL